jgi:hypothetical protein
VNSVRNRPRRKVRQRRVAGPLRLRLRWLWLGLHRPVSDMLRFLRSQRGGRVADRRRAWRRNRALVMTTKVTSVVLALLFVFGAAEALWVTIRGGPHGAPFDLDKACSDTSFSCDVLAGTLVPILSLAVASAVFLWIRLTNVRRPYVRKAKEKPRDVVLTAGRIIGEVVGRDELCNVIIADLRDPRTRRPHVVVGGVGAGKTALLVQLTKLLAQRGAVPVPVRLRDAQQKLDFRELASRRFLAEAEAALLSDTEGEKVWRHLCNNQQIVVLADGLEEALIEGDFETDRDNLIRLAIRQANENRLPLVIASRPHDPLREMEAAIIDLEPLSEEAALQYIQPRDRGQDERRLDWIVETADVAETPLYLQITRQLHRVGRMEYISPRREGGQLDTRSVDRAELRLRLLDTWTRALVEGHFPPGLPLSREDRQATVEQLSVLACIGLQQDRLHVKFDDFDALQGQPPTAAGTESREEKREPSMIEEVLEDVRERLQKLGHSFDIRLAATRGMQLGLVEARGDGVRFPHSIMQAYLGSRLIDVAMANKQYRDKALIKPGREFLIALVMHSRAVKKARPNETAQDRIEMPGPGAEDQRLQDLLCKKAGDRTDVKALDLYAAALEIDCVDKAPTHGDIADKLEKRWPDLGARDLRTLEEAKLNLVRRFGAAAQTITEQGRKERNYQAKPAYRQLYRISYAEPSYPIRLAAAQEIGAGGDEAFEALQKVLGPHDHLDSAPGQAAPSTDGNGNGGDISGPTTVPRALAEDQDKEEREWREYVMRAWLAPLLVGSVTTAHARDARNNLKRWLEFVRTQDRRPEQPDLRLSLEVALAQGFKYAANRRRAHPEARAHLAEQAKEMLRGTGFWFSRLTLVHALCLWALSDGPQEQQPDRRHTADHRALVEHWIALPASRQEHPFVAEARTLAVRALERGQPERFIWIDESGVLARVGSAPARPGSQRKHNLWIPPSTGWTALHPRAQQLVADVLLLLNLAERGEPSDRNRRLQRTNQNDLPPCLAGDRSPLDPTRTVGMAVPSEPGSNCKHGCVFELCPYPPRGEAPYRVELSEAFCRRQQVLLNGGSVRRRAAPWQGALPGGLRRFWRQMGQRAQPPEVDGEWDGEQGRRRARRAP